ncbi:hypothetical protein [Streptomyces beihaiensis]|uniref:Secreted protein n=1 Tax=Streptomyces beihaiensis TaxID=2984495 RepID=A0ABT3TQY0_9ACTN|nr:hypothetical protein [Streptomyces beihaiensis]MCX3058510.1 hypothetical protein [Streptomyces beihaiensis]
MRRGEDGGIRRASGVLAALLTAALLVLAGPTASTAHAAARPVCAGHKVRTLHFATGSTVVYRNGGYVCVVTRTRHPGIRTYMSVSVQARGNRPVSDHGRFVERAGPVTVHAGHRRIRVTGRVGAKSVATGWFHA